MAPAIKKTLKDRIGKASGWLPAIAAFLCLGLFAMAAVALLDVNSEPKGRQAANITAVSAQSFSGLRRLLEARGHTITVNRMEDGPLVDRSDLEIITLDGDGGTLTYAYNFDSDDGSSSATSESASERASEQASSEAADNDDDYGAYQIPNPKRSQHVLYQPLAKAVLIVAPKWQAGPDRMNPRWAMGEELVNTGLIGDMLGILAPVRETRIPDVDKKVPTQSEDQYTRTVRDGLTLVTFDKTDYTVSRDLQAITTTGKTGKQTTHHQGVSRPAVLMPAVGQSLFTAPLVVKDIKALQSISGPNLQPVLVDDRGGVILSRVIVTRGRAQTRVPVYLLSDPDVLNNLILADPQKVVSALNLVDGVTPPVKGKSRIVFNLTFNGMSFDHDLLHALARPPFIAVPLCLLIAGLGLMWAAFARFGPAREPPMEAPLGRGVKILADNAARLMAITLKETRLGPAYADLIRDAVIKDRGYIGGIHTETPDDLAERIGHAHKTTDSFTDLKARSGRVLTVHQLIDITLKLHAWKTEIQRAHT